LSVSAVPPKNGVVQLNVVLNRYLSLADRSKPKVQLLTMFLEGIIIAARRKNADVESGDDISADEVAHHRRYRFPHQRFRLMSK
jgi:hypothetical protein